MVSGRYRAGLVAAGLLAWCGTAAAQKNSQVTPAYILQYRPKQDAVVVTTPTDAEIANCKVDVANGPNKTSAYILRDARGQILRRFADTKGNNKVDTFCFYLDGQEVYREMDTKGSKVPDQYRWFGSQGSRWGVDVNGDGRIDSWIQISPEEVSQEILRAVITRDPARLQALALRADEIAAMDMPAAEAQKLRDAVAQLPAKFQAVLPKITGITDKTRWLHLEMQPPQCVPADTIGGKYDIVRYKSGTIVHETNGKAELLQTGELIQAGKAWRIISAPTPGSIEPEPVSAPGNNNEPFVNEETRGLVKKLEELDATAPKASAAPAAVHQYNMDRAALLEQIAMKLSGAEAEQWIRQIADCLAAAAQTAPQGNNAAIARLADLRARVAKANMKSQLAGYIAFREMSAKYSSELANLKPDELVKAQDAWRDQLKNFVQTYPTAEDTPDAILQLAMLSEFSNKETEAKNWYTQLAKNHGDHPLAKKAAGALRRLDLDGKPFALVAPRLGVNGEFDIRAMAGKVVVVYYWATWNGQAPADFFKLKMLVNQYGAKGLEIVSVNLDTAPQEAMAFLQRTPTPGTHVH
ncbi:MAG TPA: hypothetical protein VL371_23600, partial [Gemmataceae bacterium]|nr:hypothetical protein [Gemmataceae bacterium]